MTYEECVDYILSVPLFASKLGTDNLNRILDLLGHPEQCYKVVHVAGTNGKGSTCSFLMSILKCKGYRVGVFTSPHLVKINERIRINDREISDEEFTDLFSYVMGFVAKAAETGIAHPSFFELLFLMSAVYFKQEKVDYVIFETGMGGRLDATNVVTPVLSVITSIGYDHMQYLGNTISEIAQEKAGIIKPHVPVIYFDRGGAATAVIQKKAGECCSFLQNVKKNQYILSKITKKTIDFSFNSGYHRYDSLKIKKTALYQVENAILAIQAYEFLIMQIREQDDSNKSRFHRAYEECPVTDRDIDCIRAGLLEMTWPCRMEEIAEHIYVDGAHNEEAIQAFCKSIEVMFPSEHKILLFAVSKDKDYESMIERLCRITFDEIILVRYEGSRSAKLDAVRDAFRRFSDSKITAYDNIRAGFSYGKSHVGDGYMFCVGSLYLAGDLLKIGV